MQLQKAELLPQPSHYRRHVLQQGEDTTVMADASRETIAEHLPLLCLSVVSITSLQIHVTFLF